MVICIPRVEADYSLGSELKENIIFVTLSFDASYFPLNDFIIVFPMQTHRGLNLTSS